MMGAIKKMAKSLGFIRIFRDEDEGEDRLIPRDVEAVRRRQRAILARAEALGVQVDVVARRVGREGDDAGYGQ